MQVREARADDVDEIVRLKQMIMETAWPFDVGLDQHPEWPAKAAAAVRVLLAHPDYVFLVVDGETGLAGCISAALERYVPGPDWGPVHAHLGDMCTDESVRGQGVGRLLMDAALGWCREQGAQMVRLDATPTAIPIYEHFGFERRTEPELFPTMRLRLS